MGVSIDPNTAATALGVLLLAVGALMAGPSVFTTVGAWLNEDDKTVTVDEPDVTVQRHPICDHVQMVCDTAYAASPEVQLDYLKKGLTRTAILEAEVARLCKGTSANGS